MPRSEHLPLDLLQTFVFIVESEGDAAAAAERLGITQPSISKRLSALRRMTSDPDHQPWLRLKGKRWQLTSEGRRVHGVVTDLVRRYEQMEQFVASGREAKPLVTIACGRQAATGFVCAAVEQLLRERPECCVCLSTPRGKARIEGVAGGQFDLAVVTDSLQTIQQTARREVYLEILFEDKFVVAANPPSKSDWGKLWKKLSTDRHLATADLVEMPFILPEADASRRQQFDERCCEVAGRMVDVVVETGGWQTILDFVEAGVGIGLVTQSAVDAFLSRGRSKLTTRLLDEREFPPDAVRLITRKVHGKEEPDLTELGHMLRQLLHKQAAGLRR